MKFEYDKALRNYKLDLCEKITFRILEYFLVYVKLMLNYNNFGYIPYIVVKYKT